MANTTHVSVRLPSSLVVALDRDAKVESRSRAWVISDRLRRIYGHSGIDEQHARRAVGGSGNGTALPVLPNPKSEPVNVHPVQPVRGKLAGRRDAPTRLPQSRPASLPVGSCPHGKRNVAYCRATKGGC